MFVRTDHLCVSTTGTVYWTRKCPLVMTACVSSTGVYTKMCSYVLTAYVFLLHDVCSGPVCSLALHCACV